MGIGDDSSDLIGSLPSKGKERRLQMREDACPLESLDIINLSEPLSPLSRELAQGVVNASEARKAKIRELQDAVKHGTYRVCDEQIADKMLRNMLLDDQP